MRTTLKRGMGRGATFNGNGRMVLPPPVLEPMRRYRQPPPPRRTIGRLLWRIFGWILLALLVVVAGIAGGLYLYGHETLNALTPHTKDTLATARDKNLISIPSPSAPATALIVGYDTREGADAKLGQQSRSDTIMLVRADPTNNTLSLLSFPRDLVVPIYCRGSSVPVREDRINSAYATCGVQGTLDTVAHLTSLPINYVITVDFHGFKLLVNKLHGVYMNVDHRYLNTQGGPGGYARIDLEPGYQKLDGEEALDFVRFRHTDSDLYRNARQQLFLDALKDRLATSLSLTEIPSLIGAVKKSVVVVKPGAGAPSLGEIQSYAGLSYHLPAGHLFRNEIENTTFCGIANAEVCAPTSAVDAAVQAFQHPDVTLPQRANNAALGRRPKPPKTKPMQPSQITTLVLNGTTVAGLARNTSYKLAVAGYHTKQLSPTSTLTANAPDQTNYGSTVYFDSVQPKAKQAAQQLADAIGPHTKVDALTPVIAPYAQEAGNPMTVLVVGSAFDGELVRPQEHVQPTPQRQPAAVGSDGGATASAVRPVRGRLHFPAFVPGVIASGSQLAQLEPVRAFKPVAFRHELAITYVTPAGNVYWNIIETDWTDAPVLRKPTDTIALKHGRRLDLFTTGGHIHMAVVRTGKASYWVVNTLRDELSNETMLAIARGLRPLGK